MKRDIRNKRLNLLRESKALKQKIIEAKNFYNAIEVRKVQTKVYKKWKFYDEMIKRIEGSI